MKRKYFKNNYIFRFKRIKKKKKLLKKRLKHFLNVYGSGFKFLIGLNFKLSFYLHKKNFFFYNFYFWNNYNFNLRALTYFFIADYSFYFKNFFFFNKKNYDSLTSNEIIIFNRYNYEIQFLNKIEILVKKLCFLLKKNNILLQKRMLLFIFYFLFFIKKF